MPENMLNLFVPSTLAFLIGIAITPFLTHFLYRHKMWKPKAGKVALDGTAAVEFNRLHEQREVGTPRFGGVVVWASVLLCADLLSLLSRFFPEIGGDLGFISRNQTWVPLAALAMFVITRREATEGTSDRSGLTVIAVSQGASFWYDLLKKLVAPTKGIKLDSEPKG